MSISILINMLSFQLLWFACVQGSAWLAGSALALFLAVHYRWVMTDQLEWLFLLLMTLVGLLVESVVSSLNLIHFSNSPVLYLDGLSIRIAPFWLLCLWAGFAATFHHSLAWLRSRPLWCALLVIISMPSTYYLGATLSESTFPNSVLLALLVETVLWLLIFPLAFSGVDRLNRIRARVAYV